MTFALEPAFRSLISSIPPHPIENNALDNVISKALQDAKRYGSIESRKSQWEFLLKDDILTLAATEGDAMKQDSEGYYATLQDKLDVILALTEHETCEQTFPFVVLQDLLETQTIASCSHIFSWIESRAKRLTVGMVSQKGKALILLRTLNDLLRRLSKMGATTMFCGRILTFLSGVFPLGERSGVNLRGEYGPKWEGTFEIARGSSQEAPNGDAMQVDEPKEKEKDSFYHIFWSLQHPFAHPPSFAVPETFAEFQTSVNKILPVIKEATAKERAMMGSRASNGGQPSLKRKREAEVPAEGNTNEYFFAKFLTSPDLLELEIADTHFRRQFIFQLLILLHHLLAFTKAAQATWVSPRNRSLQMDFTLEPAEAQWVQETISKAMDELRQTTPSGRIFAETVHTILEREKNWVKWKNEMCPAFDKGPWSTELDGKKVGLEEATIPVRKKMREPPEPWKHDLGSESLSDIWAMGYRSLEDLQNPFNPGDLRDFVKKIKQEDARITMRRKQIKKMEPEPPTKVEAPSTPGPDSSPLKTEAHESSPMVAAPRPVAANPPGSSPLHPSLPAKPGSTGSPSKLSVTGQDFHPSPSTPVVAAPAPVPAIVEPSPLPADPIIAKYEENKQRLSWLALRVGRDHYLQHFAKIGTGDVLMLADEIEKEKREREERERERAMKVDSEPPPDSATTASDTVLSGPPAKDDSESPTVKTEPGPDADGPTSVGPSREGDTDMGDAPADRSAMTA